MGYQGGWVWPGPKLDQSIMVLSDEEPFIKGL